MKSEIQSRLDTFKQDINLEPEVVGKNLNIFYSNLANLSEVDVAADELNELNEYYKASRSATDNRGSRIKRGEIIQKVIRIVS
ncbi:MAG: hypothetical protein HXX20_20280 [Chloroflexi bacterium]|nr:hypothetical protein [Chloroflexota bacterium]